MSNPVVPTLLGLAILFLALTLRDALSAAQLLAPRQVTWLRIAMLFAGVAIALHVGSLFFG